MRFRRILLVAVILGSVFSSILGELKLEDRGGEPASITFNERFSLESSLFRTEQISEALESFQALTEIAKKRLSEEELSEVGNTSWERQHLGFHNWVAAIEGTLRKQEYRIRKLEYELAEERFEAGKIKKEELKQKELGDKEGERAFQAFWDSFVIYD